MHPPVLSESAFLKFEAEKAKVAAAHSLNKAKSALGNAVDPRLATRRHPWIAIAMAVAAGFVATVVAIPSKEERELRHLERLRRALNPEPQPQAGPEPKVAANGSHQVKPALWMSIVKEVIAFLKPILLAQITSSLRAEATHHEPEPSVADPTQSI